MACLEAKGYRVAKNNPYSGGFVTRHYGRPSQNVHCLQIEINRRLYMDEGQIERNGGLERLKSDIRDLVEALSDLTGEGL